MFSRKQRVHSVHSSLFISFFLGSALKISLACCEQGCKHWAKCVFLGDGPRFKVSEVNKQPHTLDIYISRGRLDDFAKQKKPMSSTSTLQNQ